MSKDYAAKVAAAGKLALEQFSAPATDEDAKKPCYRHFGPGGKCTNNDCRFSHDESLRKRAEAEMKKTQGKPKGVPKGKAKGKGKAKAKASTKKEVCRHWQKGNCNRGKSCKFAHGNGKATVATGEAADGEVPDGEDDEYYDDFEEEEEEEYADGEDEYDAEGAQGDRYAHYSNTAVGELELSPCSQSCSHSGSRKCSPTAVFPECSDNRTLHRSRGVKQQRLRGYLSPARSLSVILDSGASVHCIQRTKGMRLHKGPKFYIQTANGIVSSNRYAVVAIPTLGTIKALALKDSPDLLSMGHIVNEFQTTFVWDHEQYDCPFLIVRGVVS